MSLLHSEIIKLGPVIVTGWKLIGWTGAFMFVSRWIVQLISSAKTGKPTFPPLYWWMSVVGSLMTLSYFIWGKNDSVGVLQNLFPAFVALYNLYLEMTHRQKVATETK